MSTDQYSVICIHALDGVPPTLSRQQGLVNEHTVLIISAPNNQ